MESGIGDLNDMSMTYNGDKIVPTSFTITENILDKTGYKADINITDLSGSLSNVNGGEEDSVSISFGGRSFDLKPFKHADMHDETKNKRTSGKYLVSSLKCVSPAALNVQNNPVKKSYNNTPTTDVVKDIIENNYKMPAEVRDASSNKKTFQFKNEHPLTAIGTKLSDEHKSTVGKSSTYAYYQEDDKMIVDTYDNMMKQPAIASFIKRSDTNFSGISDAEKMNSILAMNIDSGFNAERRAEEKLSSQTYNMSTGSLYRSDKSSPGQRRTLLDHTNSKSPHETAQARSDKSKFASKLSEKQVTIKVYGNPSIKVGKCINIDPGESGGPVSGKCLVVAVQHHVGPEASKPRYTQTISAIPIIED